jgi:hypothetical protein
MRSSYKTHNGREVIRRGKRRELPRVKVDLINWIQTLDDVTRDEILEITKHKQ